jgi:hypothetical protein
MKRREIQGWTNDPMGDLAVLAVLILGSLFVGIGLVITSVLLFAGGSAINGVWAGLGGAFLLIPGVGGSVWLLRWWVGK